MLSNLGLVALGGALGSLARYILAGFVQKAYLGSFPVGTLFVNASGCLLIGLVGAILFGSASAREDYRVFLMVGILGGYTTFSAFGWETISMLQLNQLSGALLNILANNLIALAAVWFGFKMGRYFLAT